MGYYLVGRDSECQIRPKSSSIADRHCLLEHRGNMLRVFDLESPTGTFVNNEALPPHQWRFLKNQDRLRCGKLEFVVSIEQSSDTALPAQGAETFSANATTAKEVSAGRDATGAVATGADKDHDADDLDFDGFPAFEHEVGQPTLAGKPIQSARQLLDMDSDIDQGDLRESEHQSASFNNHADTKDKQKPEAKKPATKKRTSSLKIPKAKSFKATKARRSFLANIDVTDSETLKLFGCIALVVVTVGVVGYQSYRFASPGNSRIISEEYVAP